MAEVGLAAFIDLEVPVSLSSMDQLTNGRMYE